MSDLCVRCQSKPVARAVCVQVFRTDDTSVESTWCVRLCEECCGRVHSSFKQQAQFAQAKFKAGDVVRVKRGHEAGWPVKDRHVVTEVFTCGAIPAYELDGEGRMCVETILEAWESR